MDQWRSQENPERSISVLDPGRKFESQNINSSVSAPCMNLNRPKVVLVNPNFQRKQVPAKGTIHVNPQFKSFNTLTLPTNPINNFTPSSQEDSKNVHAMSFSCSSESVNTCTSFKVETKTRKIYSVNSNNTFVYSESSTCVSQVHSTLNNTLNPSTPPPTFSNCSPPTASQPRKAFINPKFLKSHFVSKSNCETGPSTICFVNKDHFKSENDLRKICKVPCSTKSISMQSVTNTQNHSPLKSVENVESFQKINAPSFNTQADQNPKLTPKSCNNSINDSTSSSTSLLSLAKSNYNKKLRLLKLKRITNIAVLSRMLELKKNIDKINLNKKLNQLNSSKYCYSSKSPCNGNFARNKTKPPFPKSSYSNQFCTKQSYKQKFIKNQNYKTNSYRNVFKNKHVSNNQQNFIIDGRKNFFKPNAQPSNYFKYESMQRNHFVPESYRNNTQRLKANSEQFQNPLNFHKQNPSKFSGSDLSSSKKFRSTTSDFYQKFEEIPHTSNSSPFIATKPITMNRRIINKLDRGSERNKLVFISDKKLVRKPSDSNPPSKNLLFNIVKNKSIIKNINIKPSKSFTSGLKINFKPSRTSSDVINKRLLLRKVANRYKLSNIRQTPFVKNLPLKNNFSKINQRIIGSKKILRNRTCFPQSNNPSFVSVSKTKLIRKSLLKKSERKSVNKNVKFLTKFKKVNNIPKERKSVAQKPFGRVDPASKNFSEFNNSLVSLGKNKLVRRSLLLWRKKIDELKSKRNNIAATSVINKQLRKYHQSLAQKHFISSSSKKSLAHESTFKNTISAAKKKLLLKRRMALRRKNNVPCEIFKKYGRCKKFILGKCFLLHDRKYVAICQNFLRGECMLKKCPLSHDIIPQKMPTCRHYLQSSCYRDNCPYPHVKVSSKASVCSHFVRGFCPLGMECNNFHFRACPEFEKTGVCRFQSSCQFVHRKKKIVRKAKAVELSSKKNILNQVKRSCDNEESKPLLENEESSAKRYFINDAGDEVESYVPERPNLGVLPSFIPLSPKDPSKENLI